MVDVAPVGTRRRGRPPATDSADTRRAILGNARRLFAERGYGNVTNKDVAASVGITTGSLYHYFDSKLELYVAVHSDMQQQIYGRFVEAVRATDTFLGQIDGVLEAAHELNVEDPTLAWFVGTVRTDSRRFPDVAACLQRPVAARDEFFVSIVDAGVASGEVRAQDRERTVELIRILLIGLTEGGSESPARHRLAIDSIRALLRGELIVQADASEGAGEHRHTERREQRR